MIKRQKGYVLKRIEDTVYLLPYGQNIADQKRGLILNETGEFMIWKRKKQLRRLQREWLLTMRSQMRKRKRLQKM